MSQNRVKYIVIFLSMLFVWAGTAFVWGDTVIWKPNKDEAGFYLDVPPEWEKDYEIKKNGVIFNAVHENLSMTVKSYVVEASTTAREVLNGRAAHLSARNSYIYLLREKILGEKEWGVIAYWKLHHHKKSYLEKTIIYVKNNSVLMLICTGPEKEFEEAKIIFDNAILSFGFYDPDIELDPGVNRYEISAPPAQEPTVPQEQPGEETQTQEESSEQEPSLSESETVPGGQAEGAEGEVDKEGKAPQESPSSDKEDASQPEPEEEKSRGWRPSGGKK